MTDVSTQNVWQKLGQAWRRARKSRFGRGACIVACIAGTMAVYIYVDVRSAGSVIYADVSKVPARPVAIVFGAGYDSRGPSPVLADRVRTAVDLYREGRVKKLLMTGDNSRYDYNEPEAMRQFALGMGVPDGDIVLDFAGFRTYDSLFRARDIFGINKAVLVTQTYHLPRALYTASKLGMDVVGAAAEKQQYPEQRGFERRELLAVYNAWLQTNITHPLPHFLGRKETMGL